VSTGLPPDLDKEPIVMIRSFLIGAALLAITLNVSAEESIVARVNGVAIRSTELELAIDRLLPRMSFHGGVSSEKRAEVRKKALDELINRELRYQDAVAKGMKLNQGMVNEQLAAIRGQYDTKSDYENALRRAGMTEGQLREQVEKEVLVHQITEKITVEPARMSDKALKEYYEKNRSKFRQPERIRLRVISMKEENKAKEAYQKIKNGEDFGNVAAKMSEDKYSIMGGDVGFIHKGRMLPAVEDVAWKLPKGAVGGPLLANGTWFIIKVEDRTPARDLSFDEVKVKLKKELESERSNELMEKWLSELKAKATIEIL
jgi:parvulin-like peptidyl-prolyl isomerase